MFVPALPFAFGTIAWTGYAERYIYLSSAFWIVSISLCLNTLMHQYELVGKIGRIAVTVLLVFFGYQSFTRNIVWQKNVTLLADTVEKSPRISVIREMYMQALVNAGRYNDAKEQYKIGTSHSYFSTEGPGLIMAQILVKEGRLEEALSLLERSMAQYNPRSELALKATIALIDRMIADGRYGTQRLVEKKSLYESTLLKFSKNPMLFYNLGQKALGDGDRQGAIEFFQRANSAFPEGSPYKEYSLRLLTRLKKDIK
jgi:tetratricopeptide (TPR) repeat protein